MYFFNIYNNSIVRPYSYGVNFKAVTSYGGGNNQFFYNIIALSNTGTQGYYLDNGPGYLSNAIGAATNKQYASIYGPKFLNPLTNNKLQPNSDAINACTDSYINGISPLVHDYRHCNHGYNLSFICTSCNPAYENYRPQYGVNDVGACESPYRPMAQLAHPLPGLGLYWFTVKIPKSIPIQIYGERTEEEDYIAICTERNDTLSCGGFLMCEDTNRVCTVYARDTAGNGFLSNEKLLYFFYDASRMEYIELKAKYDTNYTNQGLFIPGDSCQLTGLYQVQEIPLRQGWSIFSTYIVPNSADIEDVMATIEDNVNIVQDYDTAYVPGQYNGIGSIETGKAYKVSMSAADTLEIWGTAVRPESTPVPLDGVGPNWCLFGYLRTSNAQIATIFENNIADIDHVKIVKNQNGIIYWPEYGINFIDTLVPGQGYEAKMNTEDTILYPSNDSLIVFKSGNLKIEPKYFVTSSRTNNSLALGIDNTAWDIEPVWGDEIAVFNPQGKLAGSGVYQGGNMAFTVWGADGSAYSPDGLAEKEEMTFKLYSPSSGKAESFIVSSWIEGNSRYKAHGISIAGGIKRATATVENRLLQNYPNPFKDCTTIRFYLAQPSNATIGITNQEGKIVRVYEPGICKQGNNVFSISSAEFSAGVYYYTIKAGEFSDTGKMIVIK